MIISKRERKRSYRIREAMGKWYKIRAGHSLPTVVVLECLSGLSNIYKFEVNNVLEGGI